MRRARFTLKPRVEQNPYGEHDRDSFYPQNNFPLRCPKCNNLMDPGFTTEMKCPNCRAPLSKPAARDMAVEAFQINAVNTLRRRGWSPEILDILQGKPSSTVPGDPEKAPEPVNSTSRAMMEMAVRQMKARQNYRKKIVRRHQLIHTRVFGRRPA